MIERVPDSPDGGPSGDILPFGVSRSHGGGDGGPPDRPYPEPEDDIGETADLPLNVVALRGISARDRFGPLAVVLFIAVVGLALMALDFRIGTITLAVSAATALVMRAVLPTRRAGLLVVRTRFVDIAVLSTLAGALAVLALITPAE